MDKIVLLTSKNSLVSHAVGRGRPPGLEIIHRVPLVEARAIALDPLLIVADPVVRQTAEKVVVLARLARYLVERLQGRPGSQTGTSEF